jgi:hypothetical protein
MYYAHFFAPDFVLLVVFCEAKLLCQALTLAAMDFKEFAW